KLGNVSRRGRLAHTVGTAPRPDGGRAFEKERYRDLEDLCDLLKATSADAVSALLVFLHLLKCQAEGVAELLLAHPKHHATHTHPAADMLVDRVWCLFGHHRNVSPYPPLTSKSKRAHVSVYRNNCRYQT